MILTILCEKSKIDKVRERAKKISKFPTLTNTASKTGEYPETHYICEVNVSEAGMSKMLSLQEDSIMEPISMVEMLLKYDLKLI